MPTSGALCLHVSNVLSETKNQRSAVLVVEILLHMFLGWKCDVGPWCSRVDSRSHVQVVGRVHRGLDILEKVNESAVDPDDLPLQRITITSCGLTDAQVQGLYAHSLLRIFVLYILLTLHCRDSAVVPGTGILYACTILKISSGCENIEQESG